MLVTGETFRRLREGRDAPPEERVRIAWKPFLDVPGGENYVRRARLGGKIVLGCTALWALYAVALGVLQEHFPSVSSSLFAFFRPLVLALHEHIPRALLAVRYVARHETPELAEVVAHQIVVAHLLLIPALAEVGYQLVALHTWKGYGRVFEKLSLTPQCLLVIGLGATTLLVLSIQTEPSSWEPNDPPLVLAYGYYFMFLEVVFVFGYYYMGGFTLLQLSILLRHVHMLRQWQRRDSLAAPGGGRHVWHQAVNLRAGRFCLGLWLFYAVLLWVFREHYPKVSSALFHSFAPLVSALEDYVPRVAHAAQAARKGEIPGLEGVVAHQVVLGHLLLLALLLLAVHRVVSIHLWAGYGHVYGRLALRPRCLPLAASVVGLGACVWFWEFVPLSVGADHIFVPIEAKGLMVVEVLMAGALGFWASAVLVRAAFLLRGAWQLRTSTRSPGKQAVPPPSEETPG